MNSYRKLAQYYDEMKSFDKDKLSFFTSLFDQYDNPKILDCACGTGYDMNVLIDLGYSVVGSDFSEEMLDIARSRFIDKTVSLHRVNFEQLDSFYQEPFDVILCLSNSINESHVDPMRALRSMKNVLQDNGCIVFDQGQTDYTLKNPPTEAMIVDNERLSRKMKMRYHENTMTVSIFDTLKQEQRQIESTIDITLRRKSDWISILQKCDLMYEFYGDFQGHSYDVDSSLRLIVVAKKR